MTGAVLPGRAGKMAHSLAASASAIGLDEAETGLLQRAFALAMQPRLDALTDDHHPAYLHPARSALILTGDVGAVDVIVLVVTCLHESRDAACRLPGPALAEAFGASMLDTLDTIPRPGDERLVERLVALGPGLSLAALAEQLDHLRHLHMREDLMGIWADVHAEVMSAWLPFSQRIHPRLATRYAHWVRTFVRRI